MNIADVIGIITGGITSAGVALAIPQLVELNREQHRNFEQLYVQRFWQLQDAYSTEFRLGRIALPLADQDSAVARAYLQLCEDELDMFKAGRITRSTWRIWMSGMDPALRSEPLRSLLRDSADKEWPSIRTFLLDGPPRDPYSAAGMRVRGLS